MDAIKNIYKSGENHLEKVSAYDFMRDMAEEADGRSKLISKEMVHPLTRILDGHIVEKNGIKYILAQDSIDLDPVAQMWIEE